jgi:hypothetical protein
VDDEKSYSDEDNQDPFGMDESDDTHSLVSEDDGWFNALLDLN